MEDDDSSMSSFEKVIEILAGDPLSPHPLLRDRPEGNVPESIPAPLSFANTLPSPNPLQPNAGQRAPPAVNEKRPPTKVRKEESIANGISIRRLIEEIGSQHVFFGRGKPITNNPGNKRFRSIVDKYHLEYKRASNNLVKGEIVKSIVTEVTSNGSNFFVVVETTEGYASQEPAEAMKVLAKTGHALRDAWKYRAYLWSWADPSHEQLSWSNYSNKDGTALEKMFQEDLHRREEVPVSIRKEKHIVDVGSMMMHRVDATGNKNCAFLLVRRVDPDVEKDGDESSSSSDESDGQFATSSSGSLSSGASGATINSSIFHPAGGAGGLPGNLYMYGNLGMAQQANDECPVLAFEALDLDIFDEITAAL